MKEVELEQVFEKFIRQGFVRKSNIFMDLNEVEEFLDGYNFSKTVKIPLNEAISVIEQAILDDCYVEREED